jgi:HK97 family phage portal protein
LINWLKGLLSRNARNKVVDARAFIGVDWPGSYVDAFRRVPRPNKDGLLKEYKGFAYVCSNYNARVVFSTGLKLYRRLEKGEKCRWKTSPLDFGTQKHVVKSNRINLATGERVEEVIDHPAIDLLRRPNPEMRGLRLLEYTQLYQEMAGEAAWHIIYSDFGGSKIPVGMYLLQPQYLQAIEDPKTGFVDHYEYGFKSMVRLEKDEVIRFLLPNLRSPYLAGLSPLMGCYEDVNLLDLFKATEAAVLNNQGRPDVLVSAKDGMGDPERYEKQFQAKFRRGGNGGLWVVEDDVTVTPLQWKPSDLAFIKVSEQARSEIALSYGIPPPLLSDTGATQYDVDATLANRHVINAICPRLERNTDVLNHDYLALWDDSGKLFFAYDDPSVVNQNQKLEETTKLVAAGIKLPNEGRVDYGLPPKPWGETPAGMYQQNIAAPATTEGAEPTKEDDQPETVQDQDEAAEAGNIQTTALNGTQIASLLQIVEGVTTGLLSAEAARLVIAASFPLLDSSLVGQLVKELAKVKPKPPEEAPAMPPASTETPKVPTVGKMASPEPIALRQLREHIQDHVTNQRFEEATALLDSVWNLLPKPTARHCCKGHKDARALPEGKELAGVLKKHFARQRAEVLGSLKTKSKALPSKFVPMKKWDRELYEDSQPLIELYFKKEYENTAKDIVQRAGISNEVFNVTNPKTAAKVKELALHFCEETNQTTSDELNKALADLRESLEEGLTEGERMTDLQDRVGEIFDSAEDFRSFRIAQTESSRAHHEGLRQAAKDSGVVQGFTLLPSSDCCDLCQEIADSVGEIGLDDSFYQDDSEGTPEEYQDRFVPIHPNCECTVLQVLIPKDDGNGEDEETTAE